MPIVEALIPERSRRWLGMGPIYLKVPERRPGQLLFRQTLGAGEQTVWEEILPGQKEIQGGAADLIFGLAPTASGCELSFPSCVHDDGGERWDLALVGPFVVTDAKQFLNLVARQVTPGAPLDLENLAALLAEQVRPRVAAAAGQYSVADLRDRQALPAPAWEKNLEEWLAPRGCRVQVMHAKWSSARAERLEAEDARREEAAERVRQEEQLRAARLQQKALADDYISQEKRLDLELQQRLTELANEVAAKEHAGLLAATAREAQLRDQVTELRGRSAELQHRFDLANLQCEVNLQSLREQNEKRALEHQLALDKIRWESQHQLKLAAEREQARLEGELDQLRHQKTLAEEQLKAFKKQADSTDRVREIEEKIKLTELQTAESNHKLAEANRKLAELKFAEAEETRRCNADNEARQKAAAASASARSESLERDRQEINVGHKNRKDILLKRKDLVAMFDGGSPQEMNKAAALAIAAGYGVQDFLALGFESRPLFVGAMVQKGLEQKDKLTISLENIGQAPSTVRDIGGGRNWRQKVNLGTVRKGDNLKFTFKSSRSGFFTFINPGTGGGFWLQVPNWERLAPKVSAGCQYKIPGPELLPESWLNYQYYEDGCRAGWEHVVIIVSDEPLVSPALARRSDIPFVELKEPDLDEIIRKTNEWDPESWAAATLSFEVV